MTRSQIVGIARDRVVTGDVHRPSPHAEERYGKHEQRPWQIELSRSLITMVRKPSRFFVLQVLEPHNNGGHARGDCGNSDSLNRTHVR